jgi:Histidine kinase-like ATPase domain
MCSVVSPSMRLELVIAVRTSDRSSMWQPCPTPLEGENLFKESGRGVFLINQLMDTVEFTEEGRKVLMRKQRDAMVESGTGASRHPS